MTAVTRNDSGIKNTYDHEQPRTLMHRTAEMISIYTGKNQAGYLRTSLVFRLRFQKNFSSHIF